MVSFLLRTVEKNQSRANVGNIFNFNFFMKVIERERRKGEKLQSCKTVTFPITFT